MMQRHLVRMVYRTAKSSVLQIQNALKLKTYGHLEQALTFLHDHPNIPMDSQTYAILVKICEDRKALDQGMQLHAHIIKSKIQLSFFLAFKLLSMYAKCGSLVHARDVFDKMPQRNNLLWNAMMRAYGMHGCYEESLVLYYKMQESGIEPNNYTFPCVLKACAGLEALEEGKRIHEFIRNSAFESVVFVGNALVDFYVKCGSMEDACKVFDKMPHRDVVSWNVMIAGFAHNGQPSEALKLFSQMQMAGMRPDAVSIASLLRACIQLATLQWGREIHNYVIRTGLRSNVTLMNSLVAMYARFGCVEIVEKVFDDICEKTAVSWNAMIVGYSQNRQFSKCLHFFCQMQVEGMKPDQVSVVVALHSFAYVGTLKHGKEVHNYVIKCDFDSYITVQSALVDMYVKCGSIDDARLVFDNMFHSDVISWTAMIAGYAENGYGGQALELFHKMQWTGHKPDSVTIASILPACAGLSILQLGKEIHGYVTRNGVESNDFVGSALVDMYAKCGSLKYARLVFDKLSLNKDVTLWTAMIAGYALHGYGHEALALFSQMQQMCITPDYITFIALLSACNHAGLVDEGWKYFDCMSRDYNIQPCLEHYACMVDLLGRAGYLNDAFNFVKTMPLKPHVSIWGALLAACRIHDNMELGKCVARHLFELEPGNSSNYVLLSNIYAATGKWEEAVKIRSVFIDRGLKKLPGCSWTEIKNKIYIFHVGERTHPPMEENGYG